MSMVPMRKFEHEIKERNLVLAVLDQCSFITVSAVDGDIPYTVPVCFGYASDEEGITLYVHTAKEGRSVSLWEKEPTVFCVGAYLYLTLDPARYYREHFHDYRSVMLMGKIKKLDRKMPGGAFGGAVKAMMKYYQWGPQHFDAQHAKFMDVWMIQCKWEDISAKAEGPMSDMKYVRFPSDDEPAVTDPIRYDWHFCRKYYEHPPVALPAREDEAEGPATLSGPIPASSVIVETCWDDREGSAHTDCDAFPILLQENGTLARRFDLVFFNQPKTFRTEGAEFLGDDMANTLGRESYRLDLDVLGSSYRQIALMVNAYNGDGRNVCLGSVENLRVHVKDAKTGEILATIRPVSERDGRYTLQMAKLVRTDAGWELRAEERAFDAWMITDVFAEYGLAHWRE